ncbi:restriction endonuclease subunit S [Rhizobium leguminosarum]|uniref:restriction endonuclease subunit S n=1 Tax=Rhizobium leguminosarum TaxID=384 RepID=UPI001031CB46|nr:restriction endonuclease subunit S [Rhizobium leguminosarum]TAV72660.1 restriction endonuclease subunit S [Rhizobium leguminosarum]TAV77260.1 restriction endonuclease subunit S [Rhizobium leguminosarum]TAZ29006.1 restriction endonuclease subunit S [Rhizobium leguminosarum]
MSNLADLGDLADVNWGDTSTTKSAYVDKGFTAYSASGPDGFLPYSDYDGEAVVLSAIGARCGKTWFATGKWSCIKNTIRFWSTSPKLDNKYLYWVTNREDFFPKRGAAQPFITIGDARKARIPLPPLGEQKRIAAILDKADQLRQKRRQAIALLDSLTQSIFLEMFGDRVGKVRLEDVCTRITDGTHQAPNWAADGIPFLFVSNVRNQAISFETNKYVSTEEYARLTKNCPIEPGDVLYTAVGSYGNAAVVPPDRTFVFQRHIAQIKPRLEQINPVFLSLALESNAVRQQADRVARGVAQKTVTLASLREFEIPLPKIEDQNAFEQKISKIRQLVMADQSNNLTNLFSSLQHRAFTGQL